MIQLSRKKVTKSKEKKFNSKAKELSAIGQLSCMLKANILFLAHFSGVFCVTFSFCNTFW